MKLNCKRDTFFQLFSLAAAVAAIKDVKAVLQNVKMIARGGKVTLMATDLDLAISLDMEGAEISEEGEAILPTRLFRKILQESHDESILMETKGEQLIVSGERSFYQIPTQSPEDFPDIAPFDSDAYHEVSGDVVRELIRRTVFAIDTENTKYSLGGVLFEFVEDQITAVATDGRRLATQKGTAIAHGGHFSENASIVPPKFLNLIDKAITLTDENVKMAVADGRLTLAGKNILLRSRLIEGLFPRWKRIIPEKEDRIRVDLMTSPFLQAVRQAEVVTTENQPGIELDFSEGKLEFSASGAEVGNSHIELPIAYDSEKMKIKLQPGYLTDFLRVLNGDALVSVYIKEQQSVLFETDDGYAYVLMPLT